MTSFKFFNKFGDVVWTSFTSSALIDHTHAAAAQLLDDAVVAQLTADEQILA